ncbi:GNAT family N-acetyltransferase [Streptomyces sp. Li-HN-5-11]|uniref:GNAT family N-acetyltransferase n=1 Tax=Streptomyces sp. Li-HN-5-11 TaxID=3075432 RepID=UPI0028AA4199|nr:GNAT family N-acetyltransferase [Streptomyces sp. Li-HN-5-11]WNM34463.1 GNAT family N-acetyltransferase [Streptomyces sp. Li-HN-5-11]
MTDPWMIDVPGGRVVLREPVPGDEDGLLAVFEECEDWFVAATGLPSAPGDVQSLFYALPEGAGPDDKVLLVVERDGAVVGLVDTVRDHPEPGAVAVGLFLLAPRARGLGAGRAVAEALLARAEGVTRVTASVPPGWEPGEHFARRLGFTLGEPSAVGAEVGNRRAGPREVAVRRAELRLDGDEAAGPGGR